MRYLVQLQLAESAGEPSTGEPEVIGPVLRACARLEEQGAIVAGGVQAGAKSLVFLAEAPTTEDLYVLIDALPAAGRMRVGVTALAPFETERIAPAMHGW